MKIKLKKNSGGYIALMTTIIISLVILVMIVEEGSTGWYARFNILSTEAKEQANSLAEGCAEQAIAKLLTDPNFTGGATTTKEVGTCHIFPIQTNYPVVGSTTILVQAVVRNSFTNLNIIIDTNNLRSNLISSSTENKNVTPIINSWIETSTLN